jgi:hypothetical protein
LPIFFLKISSFEKHPLHGTFDEFNYANFVSTPCGEKHKEHDSIPFSSILSTQNNTLSFLSP